MALLRPLPLRRRFVTGAAAVLLGAVLTAGCGDDEPEAGGGPHAAAPGGAHAGGPEGGPPGAARPAVPVAVERVTVGDASSYYTTTATLEAASRADILARTTGVVREILREEGDVVRAGEALLLMEDDEAQLRVQQAEANYRLAQAEYDRRAAMKDGGLLSAEEFETTEGNLRVRESELGLARVALSHTRVQAPFDGRVVRRHVDLGANVNPGNPLFEVMDVTPLLARVHIPAKRMGFLEVGQEMEIELNTTGETLLGIVRLISPIVDAATGTVKVTAEIHEYPPATRPGDFAQVAIVTARHEDAFLVPSKAVLEEQGESVLYVVEDGKAVRRVVESGFVDGDYTEIVTGVAPEELVVVKGQRQLRPDGAVDILEGPPDVLAEVAAQKGGGEPGGPEGDGADKDAS